jgi:Holliday junction resolvase RusA-like endonuclease
MRALKIFHTKKPDADNCIKSILDALNNIAFDDDGQVADIKAWKLYSDNPRAEIILEEI